MSRDGSKTDIALTFSSKRGQWAFTLDSPRDEIRKRERTGLIIGSRRASVVVVAKPAPRLLSAGARGVKTRFAA